ncbi:hypothetical protein ACSQ67_009888 [Phaseolus vulgaris]
MGRMMESKYLVILGMMGVVVFCGDVVVGECPGIGDLITQCGMYVQKSGPQMNPSQQCCDEINSADASCLCEHLWNTTLANELIDVNKVVHVAHSCGRPLPSATPYDDDEHKVEVRKSDMKYSEVLPKSDLKTATPPIKSGIKPSTQV